MTVKEQPFSYWGFARERLPEFYENNRAFERLASEAAQLASSAGLSSSDFEEGLHQLYDAYFSFLHAMNEFSADKGDDHRHWHNHFKDARLLKKVGEPPITAELLSDSAQSYLKGSLRVQSFDRALLDAFIAQETFAFIDRSAGAGAALTGGGCLVIPLAFIGGWRVLTGTAEWERLATGGALIVGIWALFLLWPRRGSLSLYRAMRDTYHLLSGSVVSVPELRRAVERARARGVAWPPELYAVLDDVEQRATVLA